LLQQNSKQMKLEMMERSFKQLKNFTKFSEKIPRQKGKFLGLFEALNKPNLGSF
jgi:hypothetical protein